MSRSLSVFWIKASFVTAFSLSVAFVAAHLLLTPTSVHAHGKPAAADAQVDSTIYLKQGWSQADREMFYQIPQGATVIDYDIFLNLETASSEDLFRSDANSDRYGLIPQAANPRTNPDALPVGLTKTIPTGEWKDQGAQIGVTCAACHATNLSYQGKQVRIDGGVANHFDFMAYVYALDAALQATLTDTAKFARLAERMGASSPEAKTALRRRYEVDATSVHRYATRELVASSPAGPGRVDAFSLIINRVIADQTNIHQNWSTPNAPAKYPFIWNAPQGSWTQWRGVAADPIARNLGETMGVFMSMDLTSKTPEDGLFTSNAAIPNLVKIEDAIQRLAPPKWPEKVLGKIDRQKAHEGKALFMANCARCHNSFPYTWTAASDNKYGKRFVEVGMINYKYVGTDPGQFTVIRPDAITGEFASYMPGPYKDKAVVPTGVMFETLLRTVQAKAYSELKMTDVEEAELHGYRGYPSPPAPEGNYKAGPRDGVWATAPFLHNGSVPNLYEMLLPASQRTKKFYIGREFDPVKVGLDTTGNSGKFLMDTTLRGNSNQGHSFEDGPLGNGVVGRLFTDQERWEIVEYLKSIPEVEGQVTPFGGTPDAKSGHGDWAKK
jgi:hypothetical protein